MKGHDGLCPTPNPHLFERKNCAYCNLIDAVREYYNGKKGKGNDKTYQEGFNDGWEAAIDKLKELKGV
jgi:hypothetical protein